MTSAASRLLREVRDISSQQIPVVFGEPEEQEADILHSCRLHAALTGVRRAAGAPSRCAEVTRARRVAAFWTIYLTVPFYTCELCAHKRHENAHTLNNCKLKSSLARSNLIFWQLPLQM